MEFFLIYFNYTPFHTAAEEGKANVVEFLMSLDSVDINSKNISFDFLNHISYIKFFFIKFLFNFFEWSFIIE